MGETALKNMTTSSRMTYSSLCKNYKDSVDSASEKASVHLGIICYSHKHIPESMAIMAWLLRYAIIDKASFGVFVQWLTMSKPTYEQRGAYGTIDIWDPIWIRDNMLLRLRLL